MEPRTRIARFGEQVVFCPAVVGAVALGLGITDYFRDHRYISAYLIAYIGFRFAELMVGEDPRHPPRRRCPRPRIQSQIAVLILFAAAPFERTYLYGGEPPTWVGALGLLLELAGYGSRSARGSSCDFFPRTKAGANRCLVKPGFFSLHPPSGVRRRPLVMFAWPLVFAAPIVFSDAGGRSRFAHRVRSAEEATLAARFGEEFDDYLRTTDALVPAIW